MGPAPLSQASAGCSSQGRLASSRQPRSPPPSLPRSLFPPPFSAFPSGRGHFLTRLTACNFLPCSTPRVLVLFPSHPLCQPQVSFALPAGCPGLFPKPAQCAVCAPARGAPCPCVGPPALKSRLSPGMGRAGPLRVPCYRPPSRAKGQNGGRPERGLRAPVCAAGIGAGRTLLLLLWEPRSHLVTN